MIKNTETDRSPNENEMENVINYIDSIVTTINPDMNAAIPEQHPCQKSSDEIDDSTQDYIELINKLQRHTRCSSYCLRKKKRPEIRPAGLGFLKSWWIKQQYMIIMVNQN